MSFALECLDGAYTKLKARALMYLHAFRVVLVSLYFRLCLFAGERVEPICARKKDFTPNYVVCVFAFFFLREISIAHIQIVGNNNHQTVI